MKVLLTLAIPLTVLAALAITTDQRNQIRTAKMAVLGPRRVCSTTVWGSAFDNSEKRIAITTYGD
jgi:hypothetical protein